MRIRTCASLTTQLTIKRRIFLTILLAAALLVVDRGELGADVVVMKDGFTLKGKIKEEKEILAEGQVITLINKLNGFRMVDDGARRMIFAHKQVQEVFDTDLEEGKRDLHLTSLITRLDRFNLPGGRYDGFTPWNAKWDRIARIKSPEKKTPWEIPQHMSALTPHYAFIQARRHNWSPCYLTTELELESIRSLLSNHPNLKLKGDKDDVAKRFIIHRFYVEAGLYEAALAELDRILKDMPDQKEQVDKYRDALRKRLTGELLDLVEQAQKVGRHQWVQAQLANFPKQDLDQNQLVRLRGLQNTYETISKNMSLARGFLQQLPASLGESSPRGLFAEAAATMIAELNPDTIGKLETFVTYAQQAESEKHKNRTPGNSPDQLLSLAVTGWLLGNPAAEAKVDTATRLWQARQFFLQYQRSNDVRERKNLLATYQRGSTIAFDELDQLIKTLPPTDPYETSAANGSPVGGLPSGGNSFSLALLTAYRSAPNARMELKANLPWTFRKGADYLLQMPPEYHPGRLYPVLIVLHEGAEKPDDMLKRWSASAAQLGYLLVSPEWENSARLGYHYTLDEQRAVIDVLRDVKQHFQVDSDRVFLSGQGEGGNMAFDVGLSHPDLFAGVVPIGGRPQYFAKSYWPNAQYLPFYVVDGDLDGPGAKDNRLQFQKWMSKQYPALFIQYKGRGSEWFDGELPYIFDWMSRKKREPAYPVLGKHALGGASEDFQCMRTTDNQFYWLAGEELNDRYVNDSRSWRNNAGAATLQAFIKDNDIHVNARGFKRLTIWLGQGMLDYEKQTRIFINQQLVRGVRKITPSLETLLEDFYLRGDRQRHYFAKVEVPL